MHAIIYIYMYGQAWVHALRRLTKLSVCPLPHCTQKGGVLFSSFHGYTNCIHICIHSDGCIHTCRHRVPSATEIQRSWRGPPEQRAEPPSFVCSLCRENRPNNLLLLLLWKYHIGHQYITQLGQLGAIYTPTSFLYRCMSE